MPGSVTARPNRPGSKLDSVRSDTQARSLGVHEHGRADLDERFLATQRITQMELLAVPLGADSSAAPGRSSDQGSGSRQRNSHGLGRLRRCVRRPSARSACQRTRARPWIDRLESDQPWPGRIEQRGASSHHCADEIFLRRHMRAMPRSYAVVWPFNSLPVMWPFSMRMTFRDSSP